jgi:hypothetical protein
LVDKGGRRTSFWLLVLLRHRQSERERERGGRESSDSGFREGGREGEGEILGWGRTYNSGEKARGRDREMHLRKKERGGENRLGEEERSG